MDNLDHARGRFPVWAPQAPQGADSKADLPAWLIFDVRLFLIGTGEWAALARARHSVDNPRSQSAAPPGTGTRSWCPGRWGCRSFLAGAAWLPPASYLCRTPCLGLSWYGLGIGLLTTGVGLYTSVHPRTWQRHSSSTHPAPPSEGHFSTPPRASLAVEFLLLITSHDVTINTR